MSIHFLKNWPEGSWVFNYDFPNRSFEDIYTEYLRTISKGIETGLYDVVGHLDIIKTGGHSMLRLVPEELSKVLQEVQKQNMVVEINSSGHRKTVNEPYPSLEMLDLLKEYNIPICVGSDSHAPNQVGLQFNEVYKSLKDSGIEYLTYFEKRKQIQKKLSEIFVEEYI